MASYEKIKNTLNFAVSFNPSSAFPIDARSMFGKYTDAVAAAATAENAGSSNTQYYIGQILTVFENDVVAHYSIQADKTLKAVGAAVIGDDKTITVDGSGKIGIKNFGVRYYKYNNISHGYDLTEGWVSGLEPRVIGSDEGGFELAWYQPSDITVEGLESSISTIRTDLSSLTEKVGTDKQEVQGLITAETDRATAAEGELGKRVSANETAIRTLNADSQTEGSIDFKIAKVVDTYLTGQGAEGLDTLKELVAWATEHASSVLEMNSSITANKTAIGALETLVGTLPEAATATDVFGYIAEAVGKEQSRAEAAEGALRKSIEEVKAVTDSYDPSAFATAAQGAKADTAVQKIAAGSTNGHIMVDDKTDVVAYTLKPATTTELGGIKPDGTSIGTNGEGVASVVAVDVSKVTGLDVKLNGIKETAVTESNEYVDTNAVLKSAIVDTSNVAGDTASASSAKVVSESLLLDALTWKTEM